MRCSGALDVVNRHEKCWASWLALDEKDFRRGRRDGAGGWVHAPPPGGFEGGEAPRLKGRRGGKSATFASSIPATIPVAQMAKLVSTVPFSSEIRAAQNLAQVVVPALPGGIPLLNCFEALRKNDENDAPIDGHDIFFGDESDPENLPGSDRRDGEVVEEAIPMEARPRIVTIGLEVLDGVDLSEEFHQRPHTMRSVPFTMRGAYRGAVQGALDEIIVSDIRKRLPMDENSVSHSIEAVNKQVSWLPVGSNWSLESRSSWRG